MVIIKDDDAWVILKTNFAPENVTIKSQSDISLSSFYVEPQQQLNCTPSEKYNYKMNDSITFFRIIKRLN